MLKVVLTVAVLYCGIDGNEEAKCFVGYENQEVVGMSESLIRMRASELAADARPDMARCRVAAAENSLYTARSCSVVSSISIGNEDDGEVAYRKIVYQEVFVGGICRYADLTKGDRSGPKDTVEVVCGRAV